VAIDEGKDSIHHRMGIALAKFYQCIGEALFKE
jgi:hypothetical protein